MKTDATKTYRPALAGDVGVTRKGTEGSDTEISNSESIDDAATPLVTVLVLNWNRRKDLLEALASVRRQTYRTLDILVVDNGSTDGSVEAAESNFPEARIVRLDRNYGCPGGRNRGIVQAQGEFIFFLDNDGLLREDAVELAVNQMSTAPRIAVITAKTVYYKTGEERFLFGIQKGKVNESFFTNAFSGGASMHRASIYKEVGTYPDDYMYGGEEGDLALRLLDSAYLIKYVPDVVMYHKILNSARDRPQEFLYRCSNALATAWRLWPIELAILYTFGSPFTQGREAFRKGWMRSWLKDLPRRAARMIEAMKQRRPVRRSTIVYSRHLRTLYPTEPMTHPESVSFKEYIFGAIFRSWN